MATNRDINRR